MADHTLFELEKDYYLGDYQECIKKANAMQPGTKSTFYMCLSYFHLKKYDILQHEIKQSDEPCIDLIDRLYYLTENPNKKDKVLDHLSQLAQNNVLDPKDDLSRLISSSIYARLGLYQEALRELHQLDSWPASLTQIGIYLLMNRVDLAERLLKVMQNKDSFSTFTSLASAQVRLASGDASNAYADAKALEQINRATPIIKNIQTAAAISLGNYTLAKEHCEEALDLDNGNLEALINMIHIMSRLKASTDVRERHFERLRALYPDHDFVKEMDSLKELPVQ